MACLIDVKHHNSFPTLENATGADSRSQFRIALSVRAPRSIGNQPPVSPEPHHFFLAKTAAATGGRQAIEHDSFLGDAKHLGIQINWTRIPHIPSMITVATSPATTAPPTINRSANALLTPCAIMTSRAPAARCARRKNAPNQ